MLRRPHEPARRAPVDGDDGTRETISIVGELSR